jgi:hypothetical protein
MISLLENYDINSEISKSFKTTNYSQWERQKQPSQQAKKSGRLFKNDIHIRIIIVKLLIHFSG